VQWVVREITLGDRRRTVGAVRGKEHSMIRLDHLAITVRDCARSRQWYTKNFGFQIEIDIPERHTVGLKDDKDFTLFLAERPAREVAASCTLAFQVDDVESKYRHLSERGLRFERAPQKLFWGYGAELRDPDGYLIYLWDERSMREKGGG
jgi:predicted enzyme related to lactoylglutathione lyase